MSAQQEIANAQHFKSVEFYHSRYVNTVYVHATHGKSNVYANHLLDDAMAICGSPYYRLSNRRWSQESLTFLKLFAK